MRKTILENIMYFQGLVLFDGSDGVRRSFCRKFFFYSYLCMVGFSVHAADEIPIGVFEEPIAGRPFPVLIEAGDTELGQAVEVVFDLTNASRRELKFDRIVEGCACLAVSPQEGTVGVGQTKRFKAKVEVPPASGKPTYAVGFDAFEGESRAFRIAIRFDLNGHAAFVQRRLELELKSESAETVSVPIRIKRSRDVAASSVDVQLLRSKEFLTISRMQDDLFSAEVRADQISNLPQSCLLKLTDKTGKVFDSIPLRIDEKSPIEVFPSIVRFVAAKDSGTGNGSKDSGEWEGFVMLFDATDLKTDSSPVRLSAHYFASLRATS
ncbi:MAG: hypothetical protein AAF958_05020 [Planctomycetota bacterium]